MAKQIAIELLMILGIGLALGLIGPFDTYEIATPLRLAYWMTFGVAGYAIFRPLVTVGEWVSETLSLSRFLGIGIALLIAAMPMTLLVAALLFRFDVAQALRWDGIGLLYFQVWLIGFLTNGFFQLLFRKAGVNIALAVAAPSVQPKRECGFVDRLPVGFGPLLALRGEDHYVRAIGEAREELVLMRLRDAMMELAPIEGMAVHRSWWVARAAIKSFRRDGRALTLILYNGSEVPVARENAPKIRKAGWLYRLG
jgi:LytTr DNA-binding domain